MEDDAGPAAPPDDGVEVPAGFETRAIHVGQEPDPATGAVAVPVYQTSTYAQPDLDHDPEFSYARTANPTRRALERCLASLEGARHGIAFASGMAASDAVLRRLGPDDHVLMPHQGYGGTWKLVTRVLPVRYDAVDQSDLDAVAAAWRPETRVVWVESPTNPTLGIVDIEALARLAHERGALCVVDNTLATPYLQRPLELGADVVVHSTTKYLGGHSDVIGGFVACDDDELAAAITLVQHAAGAVPGPMDCFLVLRGVKTLAVRMDRHCRNAGVVADALAAHPAVEQRAVAGPALAPGARHRPPPDARLRRDGGVHPGRRRGRGPPCGGARRGCSPWGSRWAGWSRCSATRRS